MTSSISSSSNPPLPLESTQPNLPAVAKQMQSQIGLFVEHLSALTSNQVQGSRGDFLSEMAKNVSSLNQIINETLKLRGS